ncbi:MAG: hypothetical protein GXP49_05570 [Deltaproteobacteria bacterium]|nr:hypothetical protein [Deltaproteobacteria bacterium]
MPDDAATLRAMAEHTKPKGYGLFFLPLERPGHNPDHVRIYTAAGFTMLLKDAGWRPVETWENFRYASHWVQVLNWPSRRRIPVIGQLVEAAKNVTLSAGPASVMRRLEATLNSLYVMSYQLTVLARKLA